MKDDKRKDDRRKHNPEGDNDVMDAVISIERRIADSERRRAEDEEFIRRHHEEEANAMKSAIQEWVTKVVNASEKPHAVWDKYKEGEDDEKDSG